MAETTPSYIQQAKKTPSAWLTILIFIVIAHFNPEVLTGSTKIENYFSPFNLALGMPFYGLQVAIIGDLASRFEFKWRTIYIVGLIYGIFEEGFAVMTMTLPTPPGMTNELRILGVNFVWAAYIDVFHAVISVLSSILIIRLIWPERVSQPFLHRRHYAVIVPALIAIYAVLIGFVIATSHYVPMPSATVILAICCIVLAYLAWQSQKNNLMAGERSPTNRQYLKWSGGLIVASAPLVLIASFLEKTGTAALGLAVVVGYLFFLLFGKVDADPNMTRSKLLLLFSVFVGFWLVFAAFFFRTPLSTAVSVAGVVAQIYFAWRRIHSRPTFPAAAEKNTDLKETIA